jgi:hypothetical protein
MSTSNSPAPQVPDPSKNPQISHNSFSFLHYLHSTQSPGEKVTNNPDYGNHSPHHLKPKTIFRNLWLDHMHNRSSIGNHWNNHLPPVQGQETVGQSQTRRVS